MCRQIPAGRLFCVHRERNEARARLRAAPEPDEFGLTEPNAKGRQYRHYVAQAVLRNVDIAPSGRVRSR